MLAVPEPDGPLLRVGRASGCVARPWEPATKVVWPQAVADILGPYMPADPDLWNPPSGTDAEISTLRSQSARARPVSLDPARLLWCAETAAKYLPKTSPVSCSDSDLFENVLGDLKATSASGYPYQILGQTIEQVLRHPVYMHTLKTAVIARLALLRTVEPVELEGALLRNPSASLVNNWADPLRVILKDEPTPGRKIEKKAWRFVLVLSLADQILERMLFSKQNKAEIKAWSTIPSKPGMGSSDEDAALLTQFVEANALNTMSDASGWDQTVPLGMLRAESERRIHCCPDSDPEWRRAVRNVFILRAYKNQ